jgi:hypothetical protein
MWLVLAACLKYATLSERNEIVTLVFSLFNFSSSGEGKKFYSINRLISVLNLLLHMFFSLFSSNQHQ